MILFKSNTELKRPVNDIYLFLADMNNHKQLMPDNIQEWSSTKDQASFNIQNMAKLSIKVYSRVENKQVRIIPAEKPPFDLELNWELTTNGETTEVFFTISADLNMMMKMFASGPLQKLADHEMESLTSLFS